jgi:hypothetical protein
MYNYLRKIQLNNLFINAKILITISEEKRKQDKNRSTTQYTEK